jgi:hypothetical protein
MNHGYQGEYRRRQVDIAKQLFSVMGIDREDTEKRQDWVMCGFSHANFQLWCHKFKYSM